MSKSLGNGVDPLEVIDEKARTLRYYLVWLRNDAVIRAYRSQSDWPAQILNASRFVLMNMQDFQSTE